MNLPYPALITNKATGEKLTVKITFESPQAFDVRVKGCTDVNCFKKEEWTVTPIVSVPLGLGAVVEGRDGKRYTLADADPKCWREKQSHGALGSWMDGKEISAILRDGGRVLSEGVQ